MNDWAIGGVGEASGRCHNAYIWLPKVTTLEIDAWST